MTHDLLLVGGGLANCLIARAVAAARPRAAIAVIEAGARICGDHTWSFHESDLTEAQRDALAPVCVARWEKLRVRFPDFERVIDTAYASISSASLAEAVAALDQVEIIANARAVEVAPDRVALDDGRRLAAPCVIDGRGFAGSPHLTLGFQKFVGLEIECAEPHGETWATIMDAAVPQIDGYRFVYTLPFDECRILIEDTRYSDGPELSDDQLKEEITRYAAARGWRVARILREERGVLPVTLDFEARAFWRDMGEGAPPSGLRAGLFHPVTGYSLPDAVRLADLVAAAPELRSAPLREAIRAHALRLAREHEFFRLLNRMLFRAAEPERRYKVLERFYRMPQPLIERFYAGGLTTADKARLLIGKPPVPIGKALRVLTAKGLHP